MNFAFYLSGKGTRLKNLFERDSFSLKDTTLIICDDNNSVYLQELASKHKIEFVFFDKRTASKHGVTFSEFMLNKFKEFEIDYCYCFGTQILKGDLIRVFKRRIINFHPSILPLFPGLNSIDQALNSENTILLGNTAHFIDEGIDTGPIILQSIVPKSTFRDAGYDGILNLQIDMLEFIHTSILEQKMYMRGKEVYLDIKSNNATFFHNS